MRWRGRRLGQAIACMLAMSCLWPMAPVQERCERRSLQTIQEDWDPTLGFPGEGPWAQTLPSDAELKRDGWRRTSASTATTCLCGREITPRASGWAHDSGVFVCRKSCTQLEEPATQQRPHHISAHLAVGPLPVDSKNRSACLGAGNAEAGGPATRRDVDTEEAAAAGEDGAACTG